MHHEFTISCSTVLILTVFPKLDLGLSELLKNKKLTKVIKLFYSAMTCSGMDSVYSCVFPWENWQETWSFVHRCTVYLVAGSLWVKYYVLHYACIQLFFCFWASGQKTLWSQDFHWVVYTGTFFIFAHFPRFQLLQKTCVVHCFCISLYFSV